MTKAARSATAVVLWLAAAAAATTVGMLAVGAIGSDLFGAAAQPLSQAEVAARLSAAPPPPPVSSPPVTSTASQPEDQVIPTDGGTVIARCVPGGVRVVSATPAQGYSVDSEHGAGTVDDHPSVRFRAGDSEIRLRLRCVAGRVSPEFGN